MTRRWVAVLVVLTVVGAVATPAGAAADDRRRRERVFRIVSPQITESSSLVVSTAATDLAYTTNDSGDAATIYVIDTADGATVGRATLTGVEPVDFEALAGGDDDALVVADIGDNDAVRDSVALYRLPQPGLGDTTATPVAVEITYVDGPRDAESAIYDSATGRVYIVSKELAGASVYVTPPNVFERQQAVLRPVAPAPTLATDASLLPGGELAVVRTYGGATVYRFPSFERVKSFGLPSMEQGESIAAPASGDVVWVGSEGERSPVIAVRLPSVSKPGPTPSATQPPTPAPTPAPDQDTSPPGHRAESVAKGLLVAASAGLGLLLVVGVVGLVRSRLRQDGSV